MKKALALVLSLLVAFSMFAVVAAAEEAAEAPDPATMVTIQFNYLSETGEKTLSTIYVAPGEKFEASVVPNNPKGFKTEENGVKYEYTFKGWDLASTEAEENFAPTAILDLAVKSTAGTVIVLNAIYLKEENTNQSFWNLIESIFERINRIFEYFAEVFKF